MRDYSKIARTFWTGETGRALRKAGPRSQVIAFYLMTCPSATMAGLYYLPLPTLCHETGSPFEGALEALRRVSGTGFAHYDRGAEHVFVPEMARFQIGERLEKRDNRHKALVSYLMEYRKSPFFNSFLDRYRLPFELGDVDFGPDPRSPFEAPSEPLRSQEQEQEQEQELPTTRTNNTVGLKPDADPLAGKPPNGVKPKLSDAATRVLEFLNEKTGRHFKPVPANLGLIAARMRQGASEMEMRQVIAKKTREWSADDKMREFLRPATLFNAVKFAQYQGELGVPEEPNHG